MNKRSAEEFEKLKAKIEELKKKLPKDYLDAFYKTRDKK